MWKKGDIHESVYVVLMGSIGLYDISEEKTEDKEILTIFSQKAISIHK